MLIGMKNEFTSLTLRPVGPADGEFRLAVYRSTRIEELSPLGWPPEQQMMFLKMQFTAQERSHDTAFPFAARSIVYLGDRPVGVIAVSRSSEEIRLVNLALLPEERGHGLGAHIIKQLQEEARICDRPLRLSVLRGNRAQRLYHKLGFSPAGESELYLQMEWRRAIAERL